jgi:hypothetical protein
MSTWTALVVRKAALAWGLGTNIVPVLGARALDGFAVGALMTAACFLAVTAPRRSRRSRRRATAAGRGRLAAGLVGRQPCGADAVSGADAVGQQRAWSSGRGDRGSGYRSRHRRPEQPWTKPAEPRRGVPRHAAPPPGLAGRGGAQVHGLDGGQVHGLGGGQTPGPDDGRHGTALTARG